MGELEFIEKKAKLEMELNVMREKEIARRREEEARRREEEARRQEEEARRREEEARRREEEARRQEEEARRQEAAEDALLKSQRVEEEKAKSFAYHPLLERYNWPTSSETKKWLDTIWSRYFFLGQIVTIGCSKIFGELTSNWKTHQSYLYYEAGLCLCFLAQDFNRKAEAYDMYSNHTCKVPASDLDLEDLLLWPFICGSVSLLLLYCQMAMIRDISSCPSYVFNKQVPCKCICP
jgi:hypothetical protein